MDKRIFDSHPWIRYMEFVWFMERYGNDNQLYLHGFVYGSERKDELGGRQGGICIEGIGRDKKWDDREAAEAVKVFKFLFGEADEFELNPPYAWYD